MSDDPGRKIIWRNDFAFSVAQAGQLVGVELVSRARGASISGSEQEASEMLAQKLERAADGLRPRAAAQRDQARRIRAADSLLFVAMQSCIEPDVRLKLIHESRAALRGEYPAWWTEDDHVKLEIDAERHSAWIAELAANQKVTING